LWTKGFSASGVVGKDVVCLLDQALKRAEIEGVTIEALANDTVGTLMTKSYQKPDCDLGVILGTGTNACYPETERCDGVVINTEWGNFNKFTRSPFDEELDRNSANQGKQLFEKAVSGMYLGEIFRLALCSMPQFSSDIINRPYSISSENLSQLATDEFDLAGIGLGDISGNDISLLKEVAGAISKRSARLASSAIASIVLWQDKGLRNKHVIAIDGSLFEKYPGYSREMESFLNEMLGDRSQKISFELAKDGSGVGAAIVAAVAAAKSGGEKQRRG
jgi:hexokinase